MRRTTYAYIAIYTLWLITGEAILSQDSRINDIFSKNKRDGFSCDSAIISESHLDSLITIMMDDYNVAGVSTYIVSNGKTVWNKSYGFANIDNWIPVTDTTSFMLASVSKTITSAALMKLWEDGRFNLDDNINDYLPFRIVNPFYPESTITFRTLLSHTSSLKDNWEVMLSTYVAGDSPIKLDQYVSSYFLPGGEYYDANKNFYNWKPGKSWSYCNHNFVLIGYLVSVISGIPFDVYCRDSLFIPLNMNRTSWFLSGQDTNTVAMPYHYNGYTYVPYGHFGYADYPAGALRSSTRDLANFLTLHMSVRNQELHRPVNVETIDTMTMIQYPYINTSQGLTWFRRQYGSRTVWEHGGSDQGVRTKIGFCRADSSAVIVLTNSESTTASETIYGALWDAVSTLTEIKPAIVNKEIPDGFSLEQNYPNPFNGKTIIQINVSRVSILSGRIYDLNGRLLMTCFANKQFLPGIYQINWNGTDGRGNESNSGTYFFKAENWDKSKITKLILVR